MPGGPTAFIAQMGQHNPRRENAQQSQSLPPAEGARPPLLRPATSHPFVHLGSLLPPTCPFPSLLLCSLFPSPNPQGRLAGEVGGGNRRQGLGGSTALNGLAGGE